MRRKFLLLVPALALSLWAGTSAPAEAVPECNCCYCREDGYRTCWHSLHQTVEVCANYYFEICWDTWEPGDPC